MQKENGKVCLECNKDLERHWGHNYCKICFRKMFREYLEAEDERHAASRVDQTS